MENSELTPPELINIAQTALTNLIPQKSKKTYDKWYKQFLKFMNDYNTNRISQNVLLAFFQNLKSKNGDPISILPYGPFILVSKKKFL